MATVDAAGELVASIYEAVGDIGLWPEVLRRIQAAVGADATIQLSVQTSATQRLRTRVSDHSHVLGLDRAAAELYAELAPASPLADSVVGMEAGRAAAAYAMVARLEFERSEIYQRWVRPLKMQDAVFTMLAPTGPDAAVLTLMRAETHPRGGFESDPAPDFLLSHLSRAYRLNLRLERLAWPSDGVDALLQGFATPVLLVGPNEQVVQLNTAAERLLAAADGLRLDAGGLLAASTPAGRRVLQAMVATLRAGRGGAASVERPSGRMPLCLTGTPLREKRLDAACAASGARLRTLSMLAISEPDLHWAGPERQGLQARLESLYGLTPSEATVAILISRCRNLSDVAADLGVKHSTVATHAQRVFAKMEARNQGDVCRRLDFLGLMTP